MEVEGHELPLSLRVAGRCYGRMCSGCIAGHERTTRDLMLALEPRAQEPSGPDEDL